MHIKIFLKKFVSISVAAFLTAALVGCFDLGDFKDEADYYDSFGNVSLVYENTEEKEQGVEKKEYIETKEYSIKDYFYNKNTGNNFTYGDPKDEDPDKGKDIPQLPYLYMAIPVNRARDVESIALYFNATQTCSLDVFVYVVEDLPDGGDFSDIRLLEEPEFQQKHEGDEPLDDENGKPIQELIEYSDPADDLIVAKTTIHVKEGAWVPLMVETWDVGDVAKIKESQYILLRFINNGGLNDGVNPSVAFRVTNLLIRAIA